MGANVLRYTSPTEYSIGELYEKAFGRELRERFLHRWAWEFEASPALERFGNLVSERDGKAVAHLGRVPTRLAIGDHVTSAAFSSDLMADPQSGGLAVLGLAARTLKEVPVVLHFGGQPAAEQIFLRLGMTPVPAGRVLVRVQRPGGALALLAWRRLRSRPRLARRARRWMFALPGLIATPYCALRYRWGRRLGLGGRRIEVVSHFDERFDELWSAMRRLQPVGCVRDSAFLEWRYRKAPTGDYRALAAIEPSGVVGALAVLTQVRSGPGSYGKFMDILYRDTAALGDVIDAALREFGAMGVDLVVAIGLSEAIRAALRESGFSSVAHTRPFLVKSNLGPSETALLTNAANWYIAPGDGDEDLEETVHGNVVV